MTVKPPFSLLPAPSEGVRELSSKRVLFGKDDADWAELLRLMLQSAGYLSSR
jgi:hypothetical protein